MVEYKPVKQEVRGFLIIIIMKKVRNLCIKSDLKLYRTLNSYLTMYWTVYWTMYWTCIEQCIEHVLNTDETSKWIKQSTLTAKSFYSIAPLSPVSNMNRIRNLVQAAHFFSKKIIFNIFVAQTLGNFIHTISFESISAASFKILSPA